MSALASESVITLKTVIFLGSAKDISPPWGGPKRLGDRVLSYVTKHVQSRFEKSGPNSIKHEVTVLDPLEAFGEGGALAESGGELKHPSYFYRGGTAPPAMESLRKTI